MNDLQASSNTLVVSEQDDEKLAQLLSMGFDWIEAEEALEASDGDMDATLGCLLSNEADDVSSFAANKSHPTPNQAKKLPSKVTCKIAPKKGDYDVLVDLKLDARLKPLPAATFEKEGPRPKTLQSLANSFTPGKTYAIGSADGKVDDKIYYPGDLGLFGCVFEAWKNHWILRTRPEDWWFPVACQIAKAVDEAAKHEAAKPRWGFDSSNTRKVVRDLFVAHQGKENIRIKLPVYTIYEANYDYLFAAFSSELEKKIKVPAFAKAMQNDFGTSGPAHKISSQINLMASLQEFFTYDMMLCGCGIRGLEMSGTVSDWEALPSKLKKVRETLKPIRNEIYLSDGWWDNTLHVLESLANTRKNPDDPTVAEFWINVLMDTTDTKWIGGGGSMPGTPVDVEAYNGWLVRFLTGEEKILAEDLENPPEHLQEKLSGWNSVPMKISLTWCTPPIEDESVLVAGMVGYVVHKGGTDAESWNETNSEGEIVPSVEPHHMWAMMLPPNSPARLGSQQG